LDVPASLTNVSPHMSDLPILYIKPGCPWCDDVVDFLKKKKVAVKTMVVSGNPAAMKEMVDLSGQSKAPTMDWHREVFAAIGVEELVPFLEERNAI
jgi:glutaredoxin 3